MNTQQQKNPENLKENLFSAAVLIAIYGFLFLIVFVGATLDRHLLPVSDGFILWFLSSTAWAGYVGIGYYVQRLKVQQYKASLTYTSLAIFFIGIILEIIGSDNHSIILLLVGLILIGNVLIIPGRLWGSKSLGF